MRRISRRQLLHRSLIAATAALLPGRNSGAAARVPAHGGPPHYIVNIILTGGYDSLMSFDPKDSALVGDHIDTGYRAEDRLQGARRLYGPLFRPLMCHEEDLCLVHGVRLDTVGHEDGYRELLYGRQLYSPRSPAIGDAVGELLPGSAPIKHLVMHGRSAQKATLGFRGKGLHLDPDVTSAIFHGTWVARRPRWLSLVQRHQARELEEVIGRGSGEQSQSRQTELLNELLAIPKPEVKYVCDQLADRLHIAFHAICENRARFISLAADMGWLDTHLDNMELQSYHLPKALTDISRFIDLLKSSKNKFGSLFSQTTILISTEIGRYPRVNPFKGKDHWPENTFVLAGKRVRREAGGLTFGRTDDRYRGAAVDFRTGAFDSPAARVIPVDAIFATLIRIAGGAPSSFGYSDDLVMSRVLA